MTDTAEILIYDMIGEDLLGGVTAKSIKAELNKAKNAKSIDVRINSPGGSVFDGNAIYNLLVQSPAAVNVFIDGEAASIASIIAMAGDTITMGINATMMIHEPWTITGGNADDLRKLADILDLHSENILDTYVARTGGDKRAIAKMMKAETVMNAQEAVELGFADIAIRREKMERVAACGETKIAACKSDLEKVARGGRPEMLLPPRRLDARGPKVTANISPQLIAAMNRELGLLSARQRIQQLREK